MGRQLKSFVHVFGDDGQYAVFGPGDDVPDWAVEKMGDHVWADSEEDTAAGSSGEGEEPPRSGKGSGKDAWTEFAATKDVTVEDDETRDDIIAKLAALGHVEA
jgi:hypothetical protein